MGSRYALGESIMENDDFSSAAEKLNAGENVSCLSPSVMEAMWTIYSQIPPEKRENTAMGMGAFARAGIDPDSVPQDPEHMVAMLTRFSVLECLVERGILDEFMTDEVLRKKVFEAAATIPVNKGDLGEAMSHRLMRDPETAQKIKEEFEQAGYDVEHPKVGERFKKWVREQ